MSTAKWENSREGLRSAYTSGDTKTTYKSGSKTANLKDGIPTIEKPSSPVKNGARISCTPRKMFASPRSKCKSTSNIGKRKLSFPIKVITSPCGKSPLSKRRTSTPARKTKRQLQFVISLETEGLKAIPFESDKEISKTDSKTKEPDKTENKLSGVKACAVNHSSSETPYQDNGHIPYDSEDTMQQQVLLEKHDISRQILRFIELIKENKFPLDNVA